MASLEDCLVDELYTDAKPLSLLEPYLTLKKRWGLEVWVPEREAIMALRLAFRPTEGIPRLNAIHLNNSIVRTGAC